MAHADREIMAETQKNLLRDLASAARREQETRQMSPARALRLGLARAAAQLYDLPVQVTDFKTADLSLDSLASSLPEDMLLALLDGPDGARGAVAMNCALVTSLIEVQTIGAVSNLAVGERPLTPTDAAMVAPWLDSALERVDVALRQDEPVTPCAKDSSWMIGYRFGAMAENARALALALDAADYHMMRLTMDVALGRRTGELVLLLPAIKGMSEPSQKSGPKACETFLEVPAELRVIAGRMSLPLSKAGALQPGDVLPLGQMLIDRAELRSVDGTLAGHAKLGRLGEHWAVRFPGSHAASAVPQATPASASLSANLSAYGGPAKGGNQGAPSPSVNLPANADMPDRADLPPLVDAPVDLPDLPPLDFDDMPAAPDVEGALVPVTGAATSGAEFK